MTGVKTIGSLVPQPEAVRSRSLQGFSVTLSVDVEATTAIASTDVARLLGSVEGTFPELTGTLTLRAEQRPNRESRVRLTKEHDAVGLPRVEVDWQLSPDDRASLGRAVELVAHEFGRAGHGRVQTAHRGDAIAEGPVGIGCHHMGTTRMHDDPRRGVVDANCRVHGTTNLYVAGSAVFPSYGWANPTLTVIVLALRLADHLASPDS